MSRSPRSDSTRMDIDVGDYINGALVLITLWVAWQAKRSADAAAAELALARRPLVLISKCDVGMHVDECGLHFVAHVTFEDAAGVPSTLHSAKIAINFQNYVGVPEELASGILLYRALKYVAKKAVDYDDDHVGSAAHVADVDVTYLFSAAGDHRCQEWRCRTAVYRPDMDTCVIPATRTSPATIRAARGIGGGG